jgi:hypothetical protein
MNRNIKKASTQHLSFRAARGAKHEASVERMVHPLLRDRFLVARYGFYELILKILKAADWAAFLLKGLVGASNGLFFCNRAYVCVFHRN